MLLNVTIPQRRRYLLAVGPTAGGGSVPAQTGMTVGTIIGRLR